MARRVGDTLTIRLAEKHRRRRRARAPTSQEDTKADTGRARRCSARPVTVNGTKILQRRWTTSQTSTARAPAARATGWTATSPSRWPSACQRQPAGARREVDHAQPGRGIRAHPGHRAPGRHRPGQLRALLQGRGRAHHLRRQGVVRRRQPSPAGWRASSCQAGCRSDAEDTLHGSATASARRLRPAGCWPLLALLLPRTGARRAHQGHRHRRRRAQQPARRLRPRGRPRRHRRPDQPGAVHDPEHHQHAGASSASRFRRTSIRS